MPTLLAALLLGQLVVSPPDPPSSLPASAAPAPASPPIHDDHPAEPAVDDAAVDAASDAYDTVDEYDLTDDAAVEVVPPDATPPPAAREAAAVATPPATAPPAAAPPAAVPATASDDVTATDRGPCPAVETAAALRLVGLAIGGLGLLGAGALASFSLYERAQAQDLLDRSPAFGRVGDRYVERDPAHPDVAAYDAHRAASSVLSQLAWFGLGLGLGGAGIAGTAAWIGAQAEACEAR